MREQLHVKNRRAPTGKNDLHVLISFRVLQHHFPPMDLTFVSGKSPDLELRRRIVDGVEFVGKQEIDRDGFVHRAVASNRPPAAVAWRNGSYEAGASGVRGGWEKETAGQTGFHQKMTADF